MTESFLLEWVRAIGFEKEVMIERHANRGRTNTETQIKEKQDALSVLSQASCEHSAL